MWENHSKLKIQNHALTDVPDRDSDGGVAMAKKFAMQIETRAGRGLGAPFGSKGPLRRRALE